MCYEIAQAQSYLKDYDERSEEFISELYGAKKENTCAECGITLKAHEDELCTFCINEFDLDK